MDIYFLKSNSEEVKKSTNDGSKKNGWSTLFVITGVINLLACVVLTLYLLYTVFKNEKTILKKLLNTLLVIFFLPIYAIKYIAGCQNTYKRYSM